MRNLVGTRELKVGTAISLVLMASIGLSTASFTSGVLQFPNEYGATHYDTYSQGLELKEKTSGNGFASNYMYQKMGFLSAFNFGHGSGSMDSESIWIGAEKVNQTHPVGWDWVDNDTKLVKVSEDVNLVYSPITMTVGTGYYEANPLHFNSLIKERTWMKDYSDYMLVENEVEYAHALDKELNIHMMSCTIKKYDPQTIEFGPINFSVIEDVTNGRTHFGILQGETDVLGPQNMQLSGSAMPSLYAAYKNRFNAVTIDENYWGTYHIERVSESEAPLIQTLYYDNWLPCLFCGYKTMPPNYRTGPHGFGDDLTPFFDCTHCTCPTPTPIYPPA